MDILKTLADLGFANAAILNPDQGLAKIRTDKGWVYQRFANEQEITAWAKNRNPEAS